MGRRASASNPAWRLSFQKLVYVGVGTRREVRTFCYWKVVETGAVVAKVHQDVVEGLVMSRLTENRARRGPEPSHWQEMPQTERV